MKIKIFLAPNLEEARKISPDATVEAEYGDTVVKGKVCTLAHHAGEYQGNPAPCNTPDVPVLEEEGSTILISHVDLDTLGGIMALLGKKPDHQEFWAFTEYIDVNGPHHAYKFPQELQDLRNAYEAWRFSQPRPPRYAEITDVTDSVMEAVRAIQKILSGDSEWIEKGREWSKKTQQDIEKCLVEEDQKVRVFVTDRVFCNGAYYSPNQGEVIPFCVAFNSETKAVTVSTCDGKYNCVEIVQELWGPEAGGRPGIAGSPRGKEMTEKELWDVIEYIRAR